MIITHIYIGRQVQQSTTLSPSSTSPPWSWWWWQLVRTCSSSSSSSMMTASNCWLGISPEHPSLVITRSWWWGWLCRHDRDNNNDDHDDSMTKSWIANSIETTIERFNDKMDWIELTYIRRRQCSQFEHFWSQPSFLEPAAARHGPPVISFIMLIIILMIVMMMMMTLMTLMAMMMMQPLQAEEQCCCSQSFHCFCGWKHWWWRWLPGQWWWSSQKHNDWSYVTMFVFKPPGVNSPSHGHHLLPILDQRDPSNVFQCFKSFC